MILAFFIVAGLLSLLLAFHYFNRARHLLNIPRAKIRSAPQGYVEIVGRAKSLLPVPARTPEREQASVWYEYLYREAPGNKGAPLEVLRTAESFLLEDETGSCRIDPWSMRVETRLHKTDWFRKWGIDSSSGLVSLRWIGIGETIHAYGKFTTLRLDLTERKQEMIKTRLAALKRDYESRQKLDLNRDGNIDAEEWERARAEVIDEVEAEMKALEKNQHDQELGHVLRPPDDSDLPYLVSSHAEMKIVTRYKILALLFLLSFLFFGAAIVDAYFVDWLGYEFERLLQPPLQS